MPCNTYLAQLLSHKAMNHTVVHRHSWQKAHSAEYLGAAFWAGQDHAPGGPHRWQHSLRGTLPSYHSHACHQGLQPYSMPQCAFLCRLCINSRLHVTMCARACLQPCTLLHACYCAGFFSACCCVELGMHATVPASACMPLFRLLHACFCAACACMLL